MGDETCFTLAFGVPAALMFVAICKMNNVLDI